MKQQFVFQFVTDSEKALTLLFITMDENENI